jgi:hypothetical protein
MSLIGTPPAGPRLFSRKLVARGAAGIAGFAAMLFLQASLAPPAKAGRILVNDNEWTSSHQGQELADPSDTSAFAPNLTVLLDRDETSGGKTEYLEGLGGLYVAAAPLPDAYEAAGWNGLLAGPGLALEASDELTSGEIAGGSGPLFDGLGRLYITRGAAVGTKSSAPENGVRVSFVPDHGAVGIYPQENAAGDASGQLPADPPGSPSTAVELPASNHVPLPGTAVLLGLGLAGIVLRLVRA